jgi:hypothetical protein
MMAGALALAMAKGFFHPPGPAREGMSMPSARRKQVVKQVHTLP